MYGCTVWSSLVGEIDGILNRARILRKGFRLCIDNVVLHILSGEFAAGVADNNRNNILLAEEQRLAPALGGEESVQSLFAERRSITRGVVLTAHPHTEDEFRFFLELCCVPNQIFEVRSSLLAGPSDNGRHGGVGAFAYTSVGIL